MNPRMRNLLLLGGKVAVASVLIGWLVRSGSLDFSRLGLFVEKPWLLGLDLGVFALGALCGALRWRSLLELADVHIPLGRALQLQLTSLFFNVVIPGNVGGDVVKAVYAAREAKPDKRPTVFLIVFVERMLGLGALVLVAGGVTILRGPELWRNPQIRELATAVAGLGLITLVGPAVFLVVVRIAGDRLDRWTAGPSRVAQLLGKLLAAVRLLASGPRNLIVALGLSMVAHATAMLLFTSVATATSGHDVPFSTVASVFPLGILTMILPLSPAGIGVGHVAFDRLFAMIGIKGGATVFNVYLIGQLTPCLLGVFPYLALRRRGQILTERGPEAGAAAVAAGVADR